MKPLLLCLLLAGCTTRHGSETVAVSRAIERIAVANAAAGKQTVKIDRASDNIAHATHDAGIIVNRQDGKAALILQWMNEHPRK